MGVVPTAVATGKDNMMRSLNSYLQANLPKAFPSPDATTYTVAWDQYTNVNTYPSVAFADMGMRTIGNQDMAFLDDVGNLGGEAFNDYLGVSSGSGNRVYGKIQRTDVEFNLQANPSTDTNAVTHCLYMRDQLEYTLMYSGMTNDETGLQILPRIALLDFDNGQVDTGATVWVPMEKDKVFIEQFIGNDPAKPGIQRYHILARFYWHLLRP